MTTTQTHTEERLRQFNDHIRVSVPAGETSPWIFLRDYAKITAAPSAGGSMKVQATGSPPSVVRGDNNGGTSLSNAFDWDAGTVSTATWQDIRKATAVRFVATTAAGVGEISQ